MLRLILIFLAAYAFSSILVNAGVDTTIQLKLVVLYLINGMLQSLGKTPVEGGNKDV